MLENAMVLNVENDPYLCEGEIREICDWCGENIYLSEPMIEGNFQRNRHICCHEDCFTEMVREVLYTPKLLAQQLDFDYHREGEV